MLCQRCRLPIAAHKSLVNLRSGQQQLFKTPVSDSGLRNNVVYGNPTEDTSFIVLTESLNPLIKSPTTPMDSSLNPSDSISRETDMIERLFDCLSAKTDIDLPLCQECAESVRQGLKREYDEACNERDAYITLLNKVKDEPVAGSQEIDELFKRIRSLESECDSALLELKDAEAEMREAEHDLEASLCEARDMEAKRALVYKKRNELETEALRQSTETRRLEASAEYQKNQLHRLQRTNVYNDVFCIGHDGSFGTINGLRLGRLKDTKVEWSEINAAWGQVLLLVASVVAKLKIKIPNYRLKPLGSMSRIDKLELDPETGDVVRSSALDLYSSGDYSFERLLNHKRLDAAMVAFLDILKCVEEHVESCDSTLRLPYGIDGDKIGGCSIRLSLSASNETWTAACKYVLTNAKWILAYVVSH